MVRRLLILAFGGMVAVATCCVWTSHLSDQSVARVTSYSRAIDIEIARTATPDVAALFRVVVVTADTQTGGSIQPCSRSARDLRANGPGGCFLTNVGLRRGQLPSYCSVYPCISVSTPRRAWNIPSVRRAAIAVARDPSLVCKAMTRTSQGPWQDTTGPMVECSSLSYLRGRVFVGVYDDPLPGQIVAPFSVEVLR